MAILQAIAASPRIVYAKGKTKAVLNFRLYNGESGAIWGEPSDNRLMGIGNGERITVECFERNSVGGGHRYTLKTTLRDAAHQRRSMELLIGLGF